MIAGPNGSGKSTIVDLLKNRFDMGVYINAYPTEYKKIWTGIKRFYAMTGLQTRP